MYRILIIWAKISHHRRSKRVRKINKFNYTYRIIRRLKKQDTWESTPEILLMPTLMYGSETWTVLERFL